MHFVEKEPSQKRTDFIKKLKTNKILRVPGAYNPLTAKLIEEIGYDAIYVSGGAASLANGIEMARDAIGTGLAMEKMRDFTDFTQQVAVNG